MWSENSKLTRARRVQTKIKSREGCTSTRVYSYYKLHIFKYFKFQWLYGRGRQYKLKLSVVKVIQSMTRVEMFLALDDCS